MKTLDEARTHLNREVFAPVFFNKLAELGRAPTTQKQADTMLRIGVTLLGIEEREAVKQAGAQEDDLGTALAELETLNGAYYQADPQIKQAGLEWAGRSETNLAAALLLDQADAPAAA